MEHFFDKLKAKKNKGHFGAQKPESGYFSQNSKSTKGAKSSSTASTSTPSYIPPIPKSTLPRNKILSSGKNPLDQLNKEQYIAATLPFGKNLIIASAGTGKTSTIVGRIANLLSCGIRPEEILLLTFTSKAAGEMRERIESFVGTDTSNRMTIGTFHSTALKLFKTTVGNGGLKTPREVSLIFKSIYEQRDIPESDATSVPPFASSSLYEQYSLYLNSNAGVSFFADWIDEIHSEHASYTAFYEDIIDEFETLKKRDSIYDFNDLIFMARDYYVTNGCVYKEVIVDEYQDTNALQTLLLDDMSPESLFCVGDYDQSIYAFNGSDIGIIGSFSTRYPRARIQTLIKNYRSSKSILDGAERLIRNNPRLYPKKIEAMRTNDPTPPVLLKPVDSDHQIQILMEDIIKINEYGNTAVIYRTNNSGDPVELALKERGIPCVRKGGKGIFDTKEMLSAISFLKLLSGDNALTTFLQALDISPVKSSIGSLVHNAIINLAGDVRKGIIVPEMSKKNEVLHNLISHHRIGKTPITLNPSKSHLGHLKSRKWIAHPVFEFENLSSKEAETLMDVFDLFDSIASGMTPEEITIVLSRSRIMSSIFTYYASSFCRDNEGKIIKEKLNMTLQSFMNKMNVLKKIASYNKSMDGFLKMVTTKPESDDTDDAVQLLTVHASKGLEFKNVFIVDMVEDVFPNKKLMTGGGGIEEERRLFYVAVTRPEERLVCMAPLKIKNKKTNPSRFLAEFGFPNA